MISNFFSRPAAGLFPGLHPGRLAGVVPVLAVVRYRWHPGTDSTKLHFGRKLLGLIIIHAIFLPQISDIYIYLYIYIPIYIPIYRYVYMSIIDNDLGFYGIFMSYV
jgi:hypothetical protein